MRYLLITCIVMLGSCAAVPEHDGSPAIATAGDLITAMYGRYEGRWYRTFSIRQRVIFYEGEEPRRVEAWFELIELPGRVRSTIGDPRDGNCALYVDGTFHIFQDGLLAHEARRPHPVLLLGFDVYTQSPEQTLAQLEEAGFDLGAVRESRWRDRPVYVAGAPEGELQQSQFWIDQETLLPLRVIIAHTIRRCTEVEFQNYQPLGGGWIATELVLRRNGAVTTREYLDYGLEPRIHPTSFDVERVKAQLVRPR